MRYDLVAVGEVLVDVTLSTLVPGEVRHAPIRLRAGGTPVNAALAVEGRVAVVGRVGADAAGAVLREELDAAGVVPLLAIDAELPTGTFVEANVEGVHTIVSDRGASDELQLGDLPDVETSAVLISGYLLFRERTREVGRAALDRFGASVVAATGGSAALLADADLAGLDVLVVNAAEARALTGLEPEAATRALAGIVNTVCVTLGAAGAVAASGSSLERAVGEPGRNSAGTGDALAGVFVAALGRGATVGAALRLGVAAGARAAQA